MKSHSLTHLLTQSPHEKESYNKHLMRVKQRTHAHTELVRKTLCMATTTYKSFISILLCTTTHYVALLGI